MIAHKSKDDGVDNKAVVGGASGFGDLEERTELRDDRSYNTTNNLINKSVRERRRNDVEEEGSGEGSLHLTRKSEHFVYLTRKKKSFESE